MVGVAARATSRDGWRGGMRGSQSARVLLTFASGSGSSLWRSGRAERGPELTQIGKHRSLGATRRLATTTADEIE